MLSVSGRQFRRRLAVWALASAVAAIGLLPSTSRSGAALGPLDQALTGNPDCSSGNFRTSVSSHDPLEQEFVPSASHLERVQLCLAATPGTQATLNVREGTADDPGTILATKTVTTAVSGVQWVLVNLPAPLATTPGANLVLEIPESSHFQWRGTCAAVYGTCTSVDPDLYPAGEPNWGQYIGDFAFRTYASPFPGDGNGDGQVSMVDAMLTAQCVAGLIDCGTISQTAADVNCSGAPTMVDAMLIAQHVAGLISEFPVCGP